MKKYILAFVLVFVATLYANDITGSIKLSPNLTHEGAGTASTMTETISDVWKWAGTSSTIGTNGLATALTKLYALAATMPAGGTNIYDLAGGVTNNFGEVLTFAKVKFLAFCPTNSLGATRSMLIGPAPENGWSWQSTTTAAVRVYASGVFCVGTASTNGYTVTAGTGDQLQIINDATNAAGFALYIAGE